MTVKGLLQEFKLKGWQHPGYHYVIAPDGTVTQLLSEEYVSNGVQGYNSTSINVAYVGGIERPNKRAIPVDNRTPAQKATLRKLLGILKRKYPDAEIMGHRSIWGEDNPKNWQKSCPCFNAVEEYSDL